MLGNYLKFNNETFPNPTSPSMASKTLENVSQSEAGTDLVCIVRPSKKSWSFKFTLTSGKAEILKDLCKAESTSMFYMGTTYTVRVRNYKEKLIDRSEYDTRTDGLYEVSVDVTEF